MNRRGCPACAERYPLQHGRHHLPDGSTTACASQRQICARETRHDANPQVPHQERMT
jgi:hypothetical protein